MKHRVCWNASSNFTFHGMSDVFEDISDSEILDIAIEASGFECWLEEVDDEAEE